MATNQEEVECIALRDALNKIPGIQTVELCPSPWPKGLPIYIRVSKFEAMLSLADVLPTKVWSLSLSAGNPKSLTWSLGLREVSETAVTDLTERIEKYVEVKR